MIDRGVGTKFFRSRFGSWNQFSPDTLYWVFAWIILIICSFSLYWPAINSGLLSDDWGLSMPSDPWVSLYGSWFGGEGGWFYRPISRLMIYYQARLFGYDGFGQHVVSQLLFLATVWVGALCVRRPAGHAGAFIFALLAISSPVAASVVSWVSSQTDLIAGLFVSIAILPAITHANRLRVVPVVVSLTAGLLAYMTKESATILGPLAALYGLYVVMSFGIRKALRNRGAVVLVVGHLVLMALYLMFRLWRFGQIGIGDTDFVPASGWPWHVAQLFHTAIRDFLLPFTTLYPAVPSADLTGFASAWSFLLFSLLVISAFAQRKVDAGFLLLAFFVSLIPHLISKTPYYYPESGMTDVRRYLYLPLFFLAGYIAVALGSVAQARHAVWGVVVLVCYMQAQLAQPRIVDYKRAGDYRNHVVSVLTETIENTAGPDTFVVGALPDKHGEAYLFRNGFQEMVTSLFPGTNVLFDSAELGNNIEPDATFVISADGLSQVSVKPLSQMLSTRAEITRSGRTAEPMLFDANSSHNTLNGLRNSESVEVLQTAPEMLLNVTGTDPVLAFPPFKTDPYYLYKEVIITFEFLDVNETGKTGEFQFIWALDSDSDPASFPAITKSVEIKPGLQSVVFDLHSQMEWFRDGKISMARVDLPEEYRGKIRVTQFGIR